MHIPNAHLVRIASPDGHDGFLLEFRQVNKAVLGWLQQTLPDVFAAARASADDVSEGAGAETDGLENDDERLKYRASDVGESYSFSPEAEPTED